MANATLTVGFYRPHTQDRGELALSGDEEFLTKSMPLLAMVIGFLNHTYGGDADNTAKTANELVDAYAAYKDGKAFAGEIVTLRIGGGE